MSLANSIANCRTSFAQGSSREVFYSKKYNVVIKKPYLYGHNYETANYQTQKEREIFNELTDEEKQFFPIIGFTKDKDGNDIVIMKKIDCTLEEVGLMLNKSCLQYMTQKEQAAQLQHVKKTLKLKLNVSKFIKMVVTHGIIDLHCRNLGVLDGKLVIIDFGW